MGEYGEERILIGPNRATTIGIFRTYKRTVCGDGDGGVRIAKIRSSFWVIFTK